VFQPAVARAVVDGVTSKDTGGLLVPHALPHTAAHNMLLYGNVRTDQVMAILGHATIDVTISLYGHVAPVID
jgi:integrase